MGGTRSGGLLAWATGIGVHAEAYMRRLLDAWNELGDEAFAVPGGVPNVAGTTHDIPSTVTCLICHRAYPAAALGFSAIQLAHAGPGVTVDALLARGQLTAAPASALHIPGDPVAQRALGYLHANCGSCHNAHTAPSFGPAAAHVVFWQSAAQLGSVEQTTTYVNMVTSTGGDLSSLIRGASRMRLRQLGQMPPIATKLVDHAGVALVEQLLAAASTQLDPSPRCEAKLRSEISLTEQRMLEAEAMTAAVPSPTEIGSVCIESVPPVGVAPSTDGLTIAIAFSS